MRIDTEIEKLKAVLKSCQQLKNVKIISAFPYQLKPTRLEYPVIAVGLHHLEAESSQLEHSERCGDLSIFADIYVPNKLGGDYACRLLCDMCDALDEYNIASISAQKPEYRNNIQAVLIKAVITFSGIISNGG